jgi:phosphoglucosamine mutase
VYIIAMMLKKQGLLKNNTVVATVMSNLGFFKALKKAGIDCIKTTVGDKYVHEAMIKDDCSIGGEQSGHTIIRKYASTGDGILTAIMVTECMMESKLPLSKLASPVKMFPQVTKNIEVKDKEAVMNDEKIKAAVEEIQQTLGDNGRILLRKSGTEPVLRVMVEAPTFEECERNVDRVISAMDRKGYLVEVKK